MINTTLKQPKNLTLTYSGTMQQKIISFSMKLQSTKHKGKAAVLSQDLFKADALQVFNKITGDYVGLLNVGGNVEELMNQQPQELTKIVEAVQNKNQFSLF